MLVSVHRLECFFPPCKKRSDSTEHIIYGLWKCFASAMEYYADHAIGIVIIPVLIAEVERRVRCLTAGHAVKHLCNG